MSESRPLPVALKKDMIVEAIFEIRFSSEIDSLGDLLPGLVFPEIKENFPKLEKLPLASFPKEIIQNDPSLLYQPTTRLVGEKHTLLIGDRVFGLANRRPYQGWQGFKSLIIRLAEVLRKTAVISAIDRYSLRYTNIVPCEENVNALGAIIASMTLGEWDLADGPFQVRAEIKRGPFLNVIQLVDRAKIADSAEEVIEGLLFDIDTMRHGPIPDFWENIVGYIDDAHQCEKDIFFSLLTDKTLEGAGPIWSF